MSSDPDQRGLLFVVSAPSGTGKTTVVDCLMERSQRLARSRSYTCRSARPGEADGVDYNFISHGRFEDMIRQDAFLEWANIFGNFYGTSRLDTERTLAGGVDLVLVIDVQGARQVRDRLSDTVAIFVLPPSFEVLGARLRGRNKDAEEAIERRLAMASSEVDAVQEYDYVVVNDELERCVSQIEAIITAERARLSRCRDTIEPILSTFRRT